MIKQKILGFIIWLIYRILSLTWKIEVRQPESLTQALRERKTVLFAHWHGDELVLLYLIGKYRVSTIASQSKDGELMNTVLRLQGATASRGSSTRGAVGALKGLIRLIREGQRNSSFAVDGPKGPIYEVKPGIFEVSRILQAEIYPVGVSVDRAWRFEKSWNKTFLPKPFAKVLIEWCPAMPAVSKEEDPRSLVLKGGLEKALNQARLKAAKDLRPAS
jgi:lysophospholipid acyltransferase (LPLAT)-like uncharacterized protein